MLGALGDDGIVAAMSVESATSAEVFHAYLDQVLLPELRRTKPNAVLVMDNLGAHKAPVVRALLDASGFQPDRALVLCMDEKSQIQALDRSQPMLPKRPGQPARRSHDYTRHGTTSLFAALDIATGHVIGACYPRHRAAKFRRFLGRIEAAVPPDHWGPM